MSSQKGKGLGGLDNIRNLESVSGCFTTLICILNVIKFEISSIVWFYEFIVTALFYAPLLK